MNNKTHDEFVKQVINARGDIFIFHSRYVNAKTKIDIECKICGNRYLSSVRNLTKKIQGCKHCSRIENGRLNGNKAKERYKYTDDEFSNIVYNKTNEEYCLIGTFKGVKSKIEIKHNICGNIYKVTPDHFLSGTRCPICFGNNKKTTYDFKTEVYNLEGNEYEVIGKYKTARTKILMRHNSDVCNNHVWAVAPYVFLKGNRCPVCCSSKGEKKIVQWLQYNNIIFEREYNKVPNLLSDLGNPLRFDFAIFQDIEKTILKLLIEYDGEFHYKRFYKEQNFDILQYHDKLKNEYCENNKIKLVRIPYWDLNKIEKILYREVLGYD